MLIDDIRAVQSGDEDAAMFLIEKFTPLIKKYAMKLWEEDKEDAKSIMTLGFLEEIHGIKLEQIKNPSDGAIVRYLEASVWHRYIKELDRCIANKAEQTVVDAMTDDLLLTNSLADTDELGDFDFPAGLLTEKEQLVLKWVYLDGYSSADVAIHERTTRQNINQTKKRAERKLREYYQLHSDS